MDLTITVAERKRTASVVERVSYLLGSFARGGSCSLVGCRAEDAGLFGLELGFAQRPGLAELG
jgi:hypothetical protein